MVTPRVIKENFTIYNNEIKEETDPSTFILDLIIILFGSWIIGNFLEGFEEYLRRPIDNDENNDVHDMFDTMMWLDFD